MLHTLGVQVVILEVFLQTGVAQMYHFQVLRSRRAQIVLQTKLFMVHEGLGFRGCRVTEVPQGMETILVIL